MHEKAFPSAKVQTNGWDKNLCKQRARGEMPPIKNWKTKKVTLKSIPNLMKIMAPYAISNRRAQLQTSNYDSHNRTAHPHSAR